MPQILTVRTVDSVKAGPQRQEIADKFLPGLYLIVQPTGQRGWAVRYRIGGRARKHTLGLYPAITLMAARDLARQALRAVAEGRDPGREKVLSRTVSPDTVAAVVKQFDELHCQRNLRPNTRKAYQGILRRLVLPRWGKKLIQDITSRDVRDLLDAIVARKQPAMANSANSTIRCMFNWAVRREILKASPCIEKKAPAPFRFRDRVLTDAEIVAVWHAVDQLGGPGAAMVKLLTLSGQRRDEVARMTWGELDLEFKLWRLPKERTKNGRAHEVPLTAPMIDIITRLPRLGNLNGPRGNDFVITTTGRVAFSNYGEFKLKLDALLPPDMPRWTYHDTRRSAATGMARIGAPLATIEKVLNHVSGSHGGIVAVYQHYDYAREKRAALEAWSDHVMKLVAGT